MDRDAQSLVDEWKVKRVQAADIIYGEAIPSLQTDSPLVEARQTSEHRWMVRSYKPFFEYVTGTEISSTVTRV